MIDFHRILPADCVRANIEAHSKKAVLEAACECLALRHPAISARRLLEGLLNRERLGSTGLGEGVAIPHCRFADCASPVACLLRTRTAVEFAAPDDVGVDLLFVLAVPPREEDTHLEILAVLARVFGAAANRVALRAAASDRALFDALRGQLAKAQGG